jgi:hypothetical protein
MAFVDTNMGYIEGMEGGKVERMKHKKKKEKEKKIAVKNERNKVKRLYTIFLFITSELMKIHFF